MEVFKARSASCPQPYHGRKPHARIPVARPHARIPVARNDASMAKATSLISPTITIHYPQILGTIPFMTIPFEFWPVPACSKEPRKALPERPQVVGRHFCRAMMILPHPVKPGRANASAGARLRQTRWECMRLGESVG